MAPRVKVPPKNVLERWLKQGYTQQDMADMTLAEFGDRVSRSAIGNALVRYGLAGEGRRFEKEVPWPINASHATAYPLRMLRLLGRRNAGIDLSDHEERTLDAWLENLRTDRLIVAYDPDDLQGFFYIDAEHKDHRDRIPNRRKPLHMAATRRKSRA